MLVMDDSNFLLVCYYIIYHLKLKVIFFTCWVLEYYSFLLLLVHAAIFH